MTASSCRRRRPRTAGPSFRPCPICGRDGSPATDGRIRCRCLQGGPDALPLPAAPTDMLPGQAKVSVLAGRYERGEALWHPADRTADPRANGEATDGYMPRTPRIARLVRAKHLPAVAEFFD